MATHDMVMVKDYPGRVLKCDEGLLTELDSIA